jgi:serine phosphatase RsbU (regulator of sigma subunit)
VGIFTGQQKKMIAFTLLAATAQVMAFRVRFMSLLNIGFITEAIKEKNILEPGNIFNYVRQRLIETIGNEGQKDGFDGILIKINATTKQLSYVAANNNPILISDGILTHLPHDKMPVGKGEKEALFTTHQITYKQGDSIYLYTDGYPDQFGGPKDKKLKYKQLESLLLENSNLNTSSQKEN